MVPPASERKGTDFPRPTNDWNGVARGVWRMFTIIAYWDISWWIAVLFFWGSLIFVISAFFYWLPLADPRSKFPGEDTIAGGVTAFVGATMFTIGGVMLGGLSMV